MNRTLYGNLIFELSKKGRKGYSLPQDYDRTHTTAELPANRLPIKNCVVNTVYRPKAYAFIEKEVAAGHQAYVICPQVEEGEQEDLENVKRLPA